MDADGENAGADVSAAFGQRGLRAVPQDGAGLGACVVAVGDGVLVAVGDGLVVFFTGAVVLVGALVGPVVATVVAVRTGFGTVLVCRGEGATVAVGDGLVVGLAVVAGVGLSLTSTLRASWSSPPNVEGTTESGNACRPISASRPVAAVASMTMTTLDSSGPRCAFVVPVTVATSPRGSRCGCLRFHLSDVYSTDCTCVVTLCHQR